MSTLPSNISYNTLLINRHGGVEISIPRRELFDIRAQLMAEEMQDGQQLLVGLDQDDIKTNIYEGGFKTWECSLDLAKYITEIGAEGHGSRVGKSHYVELGCGTALPAITLFQTSLSSPSRHPTRITLADYNQDVLRLATLPNLLLSWAQITKGSAGFPPEDDLEITPAVLTEFRTDMQQRQINIDFISGSWGEHFLHLLDYHPEESYTLVLASETIYSPVNLRPFTNLLMHLLPSNSARSSNSRALVAAKKVYFGVGGGVDEFLQLLTFMGGDAREVVAAGEEGRGVARVVLDVVRT